jgi:hypothetical protein
VQLACELSKQGSGYLWPNFLTNVVSCSYTCHEGCCVRNVNIGTTALL